MGACFRVVDGRLNLTMLPSSSFSGENAWAGFLFPPDTNEFVRVDPDGSAHIHLQSNQAYILACRAINYPGCIDVPPGRGTLEGFGNWIATGSIIPGPGGSFSPSCPFSSKSTALVVDFHTGKEYRVRSTLILAPDPGVEGCTLKVRDVSISPVH